MTFFSGTDEHTLYDEGKDRVNFLSLIVNNAGTYSARITEKDKLHITKHTQVTTGFFGEGDKVFSELEDTTEEDVSIRYHQLEVTVEPSEPSNDSSLLQRIETLKERMSKNKLINSSKTFSLWEDFDPISVWSKDTTIPEDYPVSYTSTYKLSEEDLQKVEVIVARLVTGNMLVTKLPQNLVKMLPTLNKLWENACINTYTNPTDIVLDIINCQLSWEPDLAIPCAERIKELFKGIEDSFYPYDELIYNLENYV